MDLERLQISFERLHLRFGTASLDQAPLQQDREVEVPQPA